MEYGKKPIDLGYLNLHCPEVMYYQYLPIMFPNNSFHIPKNLDFIRPLVVKVLEGCDTFNKYVYATVKNMYCEGNLNRPGWHTDGFGTYDVNFIWSDTCPTEFCIQNFTLSDDHTKSMIEMDEQAQSKNIITYPDKTLTMLDAGVVHRCNINTQSGYRTFIKISVSKDKYNLKGNSHNYGLTYYDWDMVDRKEQRNQPIG